MSAPNTPDRAISRGRFNPAARIEPAVELIEKWIRTGLIQEREALGFEKTQPKVEVVETSVQERLKRHQENLNLLADFAASFDEDEGEEGDR